MEKGIRRLSLFLFIALSSCSKPIASVESTPSSNPNGPSLSQADGFASESEASDGVDDSSDLDDYPIWSIPDDGPFSLVSDERLKSSLYGFNLQYQLITPGTQMSYNTLWTGWDSENKYGPNIPREHRFFTYLTKYEANQDSFFFLYLPRSVIEDSRTWLEEYKRNMDDDPNYHFVDEETVIDGKFLLYAQQNNIDDYLVYHTSDYSSAPFVISDYQLAICLQMKPLTIEKDVSRDRTLGKRIALFRRFELICNESSTSLQPYSFDDSGAQSIRYIDDLFSYQGRRIEAYPASFEETSFFHLPSSVLAGTGCQKTIRANLEGEAILLPRYINSSSGLIDLLDPDFHSITEEDVFRDFKAAFLDAFIRDFDYSDGIYKYGLFDYSKVEQIIYSAGGSLD